MSFSDILLVIVSSTGLIHGLAFAIYLSLFKKKRNLSNYLLALILVFMAFRIGKSVMLYFGDDLEPLFIFAGLAFLLLIGPLLRWYVMAMTRPNFKLSRPHYLEIAPFLLMFIGSFFVSSSWYETYSREVVIIFASVLIFIYLHFAFYIFFSGLKLKKIKKDYEQSLQTKSQKAIVSWLNLLIIGFIIIWISYFLNIIDDAVPYVAGPIIYSLAVYFLSYKAFQLKVTDINGDVFSKNNDGELFNEISSLLINQELFLDPNVSLSGISELVGNSTQKVSALINQYAKQNFNDYINYYRIQEAKKLLAKRERINLKIASTAYDVGFGSLSSFNSAFKKFVGITPSQYKKKYAKFS